jgi:transcriptional regulator with XRE-family HTH domain
VNLISGITRRVPPDEIDRLMNALLKWCKKERGRQRQLAAELRVTEQVASNWLNRRKNPRVTHYVKLREFADKYGIK